MRKKVENNDGSVHKIVVCQIFTYFQTETFSTMFVERKVCYSALFTYLVGWHAGAVTFPLSDVILAQLACPLSDIMF